MIILFTHLINRTHGGNRAGPPKPGLNGSNGFGILAPCGNGSKIIPPPRGPIPANGSRSLLPTSRGSSISKPLDEQNKNK